MDITMCMSENCPMKNKCYRVQATADPYWQSWSKFENCNKENGYPDFLPMENRLSNK